MRAPYKRFPRFLRTLRLNIFPIIVLIATIGIFFVVLPLVAYKNQISWDVFLRLGTILVSWPVVVALIGWIFIRRFHKTINIFLTNVGKVTLPGGIEFQRQALLPSSEIKDAIKNIKPETEKAAKAELAKDIQKSGNATDTYRQDLENKYLEAMGQAISWKFLYLNLFFIPQTKNMLFWIWQTPNQTQQSIHLAWAPYIPDFTQRNTMIDVLIQNGMITETGGNIVVSEEGRNFLRYIGRG